MLIGWFDSFEGAIMLVFCGAPLAFALLVGWAMWHMSRKRRRSLAEPR